MEEQKEDLKEAIELAPGADQPETPAVKEAETVEEVSENIDDLPQWAQSRLKKAQEERDHLSQAVTRLNKERRLTPEVKEPEKEEEYPDWDENSKKFQKQTLTQAEKRAAETARKIVEDFNEKAAIKQIEEKYPDLKDNRNWNELVSFYNPRSGKTSINSILEDLEDAYVVFRHRKGEPVQSEEKKAKASIADKSSVSKTTQKSVAGEKPASDGALRLARRMKVDPKKLEKEDDSLRAEIEL